MNQVNFIGRITKDLELKKTSSGIAVCSFNIAVDRNYSKKGEERVTDFINIVTWRNTAEFVSKYFTKGQKIGISGELHQNKYKDKNDENRYSYDVVATSIYFCDSNKKEDEVIGEERDFIEITDKDLPF